MQIGHINIDRPVALAPMEDVSDLSFRQICRQMGADIVYTEFTSSEAIIRDIPRALRKITISDAERPVGIQIYGGLEESMDRAARVAESFKPDIIDINCGCWVKKVAMRNEGAGLLRDLKQFEKIVRTTVKATRLPVTVKTRLGWDAKSIVIEDVAKMVEQAGARALTLHCRTRCQGYQGEADWSWIAKVKKVITIPVIGNGDVDSVQDVKAMFETGCDGVMIGRAAIGNPWIFRQARHFLETGEELPAPSLRERIELCLTHLQLNIRHRGLRDGIVTFRKFYNGYLHGLPNSAPLRNELMRHVEFNPIRELLHRYLAQVSLLADSVV